MKIIIYILLLISALTFSCKRSQNIITDDQIEINYNEANRHDFDNLAHNNSIYGESINTGEHKELIIEINNTTYKINTSEEFRQYTIDNINIYNSNNKESNFINISNEDVLLFRLPESEDWLYCYVSDNIHGFLYVYDISSESFYGNFEENRRSGNYYRSLLIKEYELLRTYSNVKRYGPLLEIKYNNDIIRFWDSFTGIFRHRYQLIDYYEEFNEILVHKQFWEGSSYSIYNLRLKDFVCEIGSVPYFNELRDAVFSLVYGYGDPGVHLKIFLIRNETYEKVFNEYLPFRYGTDINGFWNNNNEVQIDYAGKYNDYITNDDGSVSEGIIEENGTIIVKRNNLNFVFEIIKR